MSASLESKIFRAIDEVYRKMKDKKWQCLHEQCNNFSIKSHLLQENGILSNIAENKHFMQFSMNNTFERNKNGQFSFKKISINRGMSLPLYCNLHDTSLFKIIEQQEFDIYSYEVQKLFAYRALCSELRQKEIVLETEKRLVDSKELKQYVSANFESASKELIKGLSMGINDLTFFKKEFENEFEDKTLENFHFETFKYHKLDVCASALFSPINTSNLFVLIKTVFRKKPFDNIFINLIPLNNHLYVIIGFHKKFVTGFMKKYIQTFNTTVIEEQQLNISNLFATRIKTWAISISAFNRISECNKKLFIEYWEKNFSNLSEKQQFEINLFK